MDIHIADNPNIRFRYMWHLAKVKQHFQKIDKRLKKFKSKICGYWGKYLLIEEGYDPRKITNALMDMIMYRSWSDEVINDEDRLNEIVDLCVSAKYNLTSERKANRQRIEDEMFPAIYKGDDLIWFRGMDTEEAEVEKWESVMQLLEMAVTVLGDKGYSLGHLKDLKIEGLMDLKSSRKRLKDQINDFFEDK